MKKMLIVNAEECIGCRMCEAICSLVKCGAVGIANARVKVMRYDTDAFFYPVVCMQCEKPSCVSACPTGALSKNLETGVVELNEEECEGCKMCLTACPFGAMSFVDDVAIKCDLCGGNPSCVEFCQAKALTYGEPGDIGMGKRVRLSEKMLENYRKGLAESTEQPGQG